ncbi:MAG: hypothetical protein NUW37_05950 [Planctomycetes bacterium]|nr:hypothetical protein [Planctomycetota bacterium]
MPKSIEEIYNMSLAERNDFFLKRDVDQFYDYKSPESKVIVTDVKKPHRRPKGIRDISVQPAEYFDVSILSIPSGSIDIQYFPLVRAHHEEEGQVGVNIFTITLDSSQGRDVIASFALPEAEFITDQTQLFNLVTTDSSKFISKAFRKYVQWWQPEYGADSVRQSLYYSITELVDLPSGVCAWRSTQYRRTERLFVPRAWYWVDVIYYDKDVESEILSLLDEVKSWDDFSPCYSP